MISNISYGCNFFSAIEYNERKVAEGSAERIFTNKFALENPSLFVAVLRCYAQEAKVEDYTFHVSLNLSPEDRPLSNDEFSGIASRYMSEMGYDDMPYVVYRHNDKEHQHIHIVSSRVNEKGVLINQQFEYTKSMAICQKMEKEYGITIVDRSKDTGKSLSSLVVNQEGEITDKKGARAYIAKAIKQVKEGSRFSTIPEFNKALSIYGITVKQVNVNSVKKGLVYKLVKEGKEITPIQASHIYHDCTYKTIDKLCKRNYHHKAKYDKAKLIKPVSDVLEKYSSCTEERFISELKKQQVTVFFDRYKNGDRYGLSFMDDRSGVIFKASELGDEFSLARISPRFGTTTDVNPFYLKKVLSDVYYTVYRENYTSWDGQAGFIKNKLNKELITDGFIKSNAELYKELSEASRALLSTQIEQLINAKTQALPGIEKKEHERGIQKEKEAAAYLSVFTHLNNYFTECNNKKINIYEHIKSDSFALGNLMQELTFDPSVDIEKMQKQLSATLGSYAFIYQSFNKEFYTGYQQYKDIKKQEHTKGNYLDYTTSVTSTFKSFSEVVLSNDKLKALVESEPLFRQYFASAADHFKIGLIDFVETDKSVKAAYELVVNHHKAQIGEELTRSEKTIQLFTDFNRIKEKLQVQFDGNITAAKILPGLLEYKEKQVAKNAAFEELKPLLQEKLKLSFAGVKGTGISYADFLTRLVADRSVITSVYSGAGANILSKYNLTEKDTYSITGMLLNSIKYNAIFQNFKQVGLSLFKDSLSQEQQMFPGYNKAEHYEHLISLYGSFRQVIEHDHRFTRALHVIQLEDPERAITMAGEMYRGALEKERDFNLVQNAYDHITETIQADIATNSTPADANLSVETWNRFDFISEELNRHFSNNPAILQLLPDFIESKKQYLSEKAALSELKPAIKELVHNSFNSVNDGSLAAHLVNEAANPAVIPTFLSSATANSILDKYGLASTSVTSMQKNLLDYIKFDAFLISVREKGNELLTTSFDTEIKSDLSYTKGAHYLYLESQFDSFKTVLLADPGLSGSIISLKIDDKTQSFAFEAYKSQMLNSGVSSLVNSQMQEYLKANYQEFKKSGFSYLDYLKIAVTDKYLPAFFNSEAFRNSILKEALHDGQRTAIEKMLVSTSESQAKRLVENFPYMHFNQEIRNIFSQQLYPGLKETYRIDHKNEQLFLQSLLNQPETVTNHLLGRDAVKQLIFGISKQYNVVLPDNVLKDLAQKSVISYCTSRAEFISNIPERSNSVANSLLNLNAGNSQAGLGLINTEKDKRKGKKRNNEHEL